MSEIKIYFNPSTASKQLFSFPPDVIKYAVKGCNGPTWLKLIKSCKYFYAKYKIYEFKNVTFDTSGSVIAIDRNVYKRWEDIADMPCMLYLTGKLAIESPLTTLKPKIYKCLLRHLCITGANIVFEDFKLLTGSKMLNEFVMHNSNIVYSDKSIVQLEGIFVALPYATSFIHERTGNRASATKFINPQTFHVMAETLHQRKLVAFELNIIANDIFAEDFVKFVKKYAGRNCKIVLTGDFVTTTPLQNVTDRMLKEWRPQSTKPSIRYRDEMILRLQQQLERTQALLRQQSEQLQRLSQSQERLQQTFEQQLQRLQQM